MEEYTLENKHFVAKRVPKYANNLADPKCKLNFPLSILQWFFSLELGSLSYQGSWQLGYNRAGSFVEEEHR